MLAAFMMLLDRLYLDSPSEYLPEKDEQNNSSTWEKFISILQIIANY